MKKRVNLYIYGLYKELEIRCLEVHDSTYRFSGEANTLVYFKFKHNQRHTRLDLSNLKDHILVSFDKNGRRVTATACCHIADGPYELYNKQRNFLLMPGDSEFSHVEAVLFYD